MALEIIVMGASGRMGNMVASMVEREPDFSLAALVERPGKESGLDKWGVDVFTDASQAMAAHPKAVVVDFTAPEASVATAAKAREAGNGMVIGTTGLNPDQLKALDEAAKDVPLFWSPNMSVGINVLVKILPMLVNMLGPDYDLEMFEAHHKMKKDAPSGTAIKLAQVLAKSREWDYDEVKKLGRDGIIGERPKKEIGVMTIRGGDVVGDHTVLFLGTGERIEVKHQAHSRETFASGALRAAKWVADQRPGRVYTMADLF